MVSAHATECEGHRFGRGAVAQAPADDGVVLSRTVETEVSRGAAETAATPRVEENRALAEKAGTGLEVAVTARWVHGVRAMW